MARQDLAIETTAGDLDTSSAYTVDAGRDLYLTASGTLTTGGKIGEGRDLYLTSTGAGIDFTSDLTASRDLVVSARGTVTNYATLRGGRSLLVSSTAGHIQNLATRESFTLTGAHGCYGAPLTIIARNQTPWVRVSARDSDASGFLKVKSLTLEHGPTTVYDFEVADTHTYVVGASKAWVHNECDPNKLNHVFGNPKNQLDGLLAKFGGDQQKAFDAIQAAANAELAAGRLVQQAGGILPGAGNVLNINGVLVQLSGGRVINGSVSIGSFSGVIRMP